MKKFVAAIFILAAGVVNASAADLAARPYTKAPAVAVAAYDWSGFYVGANGGGAWARKCWDIVPVVINLGFIPPYNVAGGEGCHTASGATAGGQFGYRWQRGAWVFGVEAQGNWADLSGSNVSQNALFAAPPAVANRTKIDAIGLFTAQIGYSWNNFLLYAKGGAAVARDKYEIFTANAAIFPAGSIVARGSETRWGGVAGIGGEYAFAPNWSVALEYDHLFMGARSVAMTYDPAFFVPALLNHNERISQDVDMVTVRVNYRFGGPVVAKY
jgi:outer membrane immunogenic protein